MEFIDAGNKNWTIKAVQTALSQRSIPLPPSRIRLRKDIIKYANDQLAKLDNPPTTPLPAPGTPGTPGTPVTPATPSILSSPVPSLTIFEEEEEPPEPSSSDDDEDTVPDSPDNYSGPPTPVASLSRQIDKVISVDFNSFEMKNPIDPATVSSIKEHLKVLKQHQKALKEEAEAEELDLVVVQRNVQKLVDAHKKEIELLNAKLTEERSKNSAPTELSQDAGSARYALEDASVAAEQITSLQSELTRAQLELEQARKENKTNQGLSERNKQLESKLIQERKTYQEQIRRKDEEFKRQLEEANPKAVTTTATAPAPVAGTVFSRLLNFASTTTPTTTTTDSHSSEQIKSLQSELAAARDRIAQLESRSAPISVIHPPLPVPVPAPLIQKAKDGVDVLVSFVFLAAALRLVEEV